MKNILKKAGYTFDEQTGIWENPGFSGIAYSDGDEVEQRLAKVIADAADLSVLSDELKQHIIDWPSHYHLSSSRANILRPFAHHLAGAEVLEIGAGCGAITRYLGEIGAHVLALEGSKRRAAIARARTRDLPQIQVLAESFDGFQSDARFDVITLIGVLEYANLFVSGQNPALMMLQRAHALLKPSGLLLIAIENQLGLKYWAGASEDHLGMPMYGLEGRYRADQPQTYGRRKLDEIIVEAGFGHVEFLSALPDYKFPISIVTSEAFDCGDFDGGALASQCVYGDPQLPPDLNFSPELVWPVLAVNGLAIDLANSFLIAANVQDSPVLSSNILAYHYSIRRRRYYCKETIFQRDTDGLIRLRYKRLNTLNEISQDRLLRFDIPDCADYINGTPMARELIGVVTRDGWSTSEVGTFLRRYLNVLRALNLGGGNFPVLDSVRTKLPGIYFDLTPQNLICDRKHSYHAIDCEWVAVNGISVGWLLYRALLSLTQSVTRFGSVSDADVLTRADFFIAAIKGAGFPLTRSELDEFATMEGIVQREVTGHPSGNLFDWRGDTLLPIKKDWRQEMEKNNAVFQMINKAVVERDAAVERVNTAISERDAAVQMANVAISERDAAVEMLAAIKRSWSWRLTAPVRLVGHLASGNFVVVPRFISHMLHYFVSKLPQPLTKRLRSVWDRGMNLVGIRPDSSANFPAIAALVAERCEFTRESLSCDPLCAPMPSEWPSIDIGVVTYNSRRWIDKFVESLLALDYPKGLLTVRFVDNGSTDNTEADLRAAALKLQAVGFSVEIIPRPNRGFGAGHNAALKKGTAPFCLVTNIDLTFEPDSLRRVVAMAIADVSAAVAWEFRQKPYEHPKFYDPVTGTTNWNAHACVLLRRSAVEAVKGYDETLFMYGEDVELSYRLRQAGYLLRYCSGATVWHYSYEFGNQIKPLQYTGSTFANLYIRLKYGKLTDAAVVPLLAIRLLLSPQVFVGSRRQVALSLIRLLACAPKALMSRRSTSAYFPFRTWDYDIIRDGAFVELQPLPAEQPLVSIITRTYMGRDLYLRQALLSAVHQTWRNIEIIVVEDGGDTMRSLCAEIADITGRTINFIANGKHGRSKAGNAGLVAARGRWCVFLDDDDLLFSDHVEVLANKLLSETDAVASYSPSWEVVTDTTLLQDGKYVEVLHKLPFVLAKDFDFDALCHHNCFAIQSVLFERQLFEQRGGFDEDMDALEDWTLWVRYAWGNRFAYVPKLTSMFRTPYDAAKVKERTMAFEQAYPLALARSKARIVEYQRQHESE